METFNFRIGDIEARTCNKYLLHSVKNETIEIVKWQQDSCYTIANWVKHKHGFDLKCSHSRLTNLSKSSKKIFFILAKAAQIFLNKAFKEEKE